MNICITGPFATSSRPSLGRSNDQTVRRLKFTSALPSLVRSRRPTGSVGPLQISYYFIAAKTGALRFVNAVDESPGYKRRAAFTRFYGQAADVQGPVGKAF